MNAGKRAGVANGDPDRADLLPQTIGSDHKNVLRLRTAELEVMRGGVPARDDVVDVTAKPELLEAANVIEARSRRVVRREEHIPLRAPEPLERVARVRHDLRPAIEHAIHVEDRDRHESRG